MHILCTEGEVHAIATELLCSLDTTKSTGLDGVSVLMQWWIQDFLKEGSIRPLHARKVRVKFLEAMPIFC